MTTQVFGEARPGFEVLRAMFVVLGVLYLLPTPRILAMAQVARKGRRSSGRSQGRTA